MKHFIFHNRLTDVYFSTFLVGWKEVNKVLLSLACPKFIEVHEIEQKRAICSSRLSVHALQVSSAKLYPSRF